MSTMKIDIKYLTIIVLLLESLPPTLAEVGVMGFSIIIFSMLGIENFLGADVSCRI